MSNWGKDPDPGKVECAMLNATDGFWYPTDCSESNSFVCKYTDVPAPTVNPDGVCVEGFYAPYPGSEYCYMIKADWNSQCKWSDAEKVCQSYDGDLASIHDERVQNFIGNQTQKGDVNVWIGLTVDSNALQSNTY